MLIFELQLQCHYYANNFHSHSNSILPVLSRGIEDNVHVKWFDNVQYDWRAKTLGFNKMSFHQYNWCGVAVRPYRGSLVDDLYVELQDQEVVEAMPDDLFQFEDEFRAEILNMYRSGPCKYDDSIVKKYNVCRIPLKPEIEKHVDPELYATLRSHVDGLRHFHPKELVDLNMGSNVGVLSYFQTIRDDDTNEPLSKESKYCIINTDMNIYVKIQKVI